MAITLTAPHLPQSMWITQGQATDVLSNYEASKYELDPKASHLFNPLARLSHHSWLNTSYVGKPKEAHFAPISFETNVSISGLRSREVVICHPSERSFVQVPDQVFFIKQPREGDPSILLIVDGVGIYVLGQQITSKMAEKAITTHCEQMLGSISCLFNWSGGSLAFHRLIVGKGPD
jgi:hypothetical protein